MKPAEQRITQSRVRLLLTKPFFGTLATRLRLREVESIPTAGTDGRMFYFNRAFIDRLTDPELDFLVGHEVLHCVYDHMQARGDRDPSLYNIAADFNINMTLVEQNIGTAISNDKLLGGEICLDWKYRGMNSYEIYDQLVQDGATGNSMDYHFELGTGEPDANGKPAHAMSDAEAKALADEIKQAVINAAGQAGPDVPESVRSMISALVAPKMNWRDVLRTTLESSIRSDFTFMRPSKRSGEVIFPGMNRDEELNISIALDTSGSISPDMLRDFLSEVQGIMDQYSSYQINLFQFDTRVYGFDTFTADDGRDLTEYEISGGGGTDFDAAFTFMQENDIHPDQFIMFTDGYPWGSWGNANYCDTLFVVHGDVKKQIQSPFGITIHYDTQ